MPVKKVASLIDFTGISQLALEHIAIIARQSLCRVTLLHIAEEGKQKHEQEIKVQIRAFASHLEKEGIPFVIQVDYGSFLDIIGDSIKALDCDLLVIGTHGIKGIKQNFVGSNILRLMQLISIPALIIQGHSQPPHEGYTSMLLPSLGMGNLKFLEKPIQQFASLFNSSLHILSFYTKDIEQDIKVKANEQAEWFKQMGIKTIVQTEESGIYTSSYSKSIIQYVDIEDIQVLVLVFREAGGIKKFHDEDLENILLNRLGTPVLCV